MSADKIHALDIFGGLVISGVLLAAFGLLAWALREALDRIGGPSLLDPRKRRGGRKG